MRLTRVLALLIVAVLISYGHAPQSAQAQVLGDYGAGGFAHPGFWGYLSSPYATGRIPTPPYFSIHPPVYYSAPVPRTYGYSPYAYPGTVRTPEIEIKPEIVTNPHAKPTIHKIDSKLKVAAKVVEPQIVINPYAKQTADHVAAND